MPSIRSKKSSNREKYASKCKKQKSSQINLLIWDSTSIFPLLSLSFSLFSPTSFPQLSRRPLILIPLLYARHCTFFADISSLLITHRPPIRGWCMSPPRWPPSHASGIRSPRRKGTTRWWSSSRCVAAGRGCCCWAGCSACGCGGLRRRCGGCGRCCPTTTWRRRCVRRYSQAFCFKW